MIPIKLGLKNFLCYRDDVPLLDFSGIQLACLTGSNGHGKSALLDAVTWALWGAARGKSQDALIHFGQDDMRVDLEFMAQNTIYRVTRRHSRTGLQRRRGASDLQLQIRSSEEFNSITGNTIRETQSKLQHIIGMDYDTFINSAFLIQGRADEFTNKSPGERKEVLSKILGLGLYDRLQEHSHRMGQEEHRIANDIQVNLTFIHNELSNKERYLEDLSEINDNLGAVVEHISTSERDIEELQSQVNILQLASKEIQELEMQIPSIKTEIRHISEELHRQNTRMEEYRMLVTSRTSIEEGMRTYTEIQREYDKLNDVRPYYDEMYQKMSDLSTLIRESKARLEQHTHMLRTRLTSELEPKIRTWASLTEQLKEARRHQTKLVDEANSLSLFDSELEHLVSQLAELNANQAQLKIEGEDLKAKLNLLDSSHDDARCPLCENTLSDEGCKKLTVNYNLLITNKRTTYIDNQKIVNQLQSQQKELSTKATQKQISLKRRQEESQRDLLTIERDMQEAEKATEESANITKELVAIEAKLSDGSHATEEIAVFEKVKKTIEALGFSTERHTALYNELRRNQQYKDQFNHLQIALENLDSQHKASSWQNEMKRSRDTVLQQSLVRLKQLQVESKDMPAQEENLNSSIMKLKELRENHQNLLEQRGGLESKLTIIQDLENQSHEQTRQVAAHLEEESIYQQLSQAFGKQGLQALLIETVLPRIEDEANELLGRMTDSRMGIKLETQRELKSRRGEYVETLEIIISDELGSRSYEMFSGGEAFKINLALRIALSKVLAHRSGAPLPTLFIDEGFGTQDTAGRERILDVIRAIESDFEKIIVITHLDELKEAFPARIEVEKQNGASTCWIS